MTKATGNNGPFSGFLNKQNLILIFALLAFALSYVAEVASPDVRRDWFVRCCGRSFWWSPVGCSLVLVGAALIFRVRSQWSLISAGLLSVYVSYYFLYGAAGSWNYYYSLDKMQAFREAFLLPVFRPLSLFLALFIFVVALRNLLRAPGRLIVLLVACGAVLGIAFLASSRSRKVEGGLADNSSPQELEFRSIMIADGKTEDGVRFVEYRYKSPDCEALSHKTMFFQLPAHARNEVESEIQKASAIVERVPVVNDQGRQVTERVVLQFDARDQYKAHAEAIWNENSVFHSIVASSLGDVLEFLKALGSKSGRISSRIDTVQNVTFTASETQEGKTEEGVGYSEKQFRSSDCETVTARTEYFSSPARAQREMQKKLKESTTILEQGSKLNAAGQPVGERVVAMFKAKRPSDYIEDTVVIWTVNSELHSIRGLFTHVLELEKRNFR